MINQPMDVFTQFPVRKSKKQKCAFREAIGAYAAQLGLNCIIESGSFGAKNIVIGNPNRAKYLITAHYDTPARMILPNFITPCNLLPYLVYQSVLTLIILVCGFVAGITLGVLTRSVLVAELIYFLVTFLILYLMMAGPANPSNTNDNTSGVITLLELARTLPEEQRHNVCFVLFDLEEAGLIGSASYRKAHRQSSENQIVLNLDCVGDGDEIILFPSKKLKKDAKLITSLRAAECTLNNKRIILRDKGFSFYPSDQKHFPLGVGIAALRYSKWVGHYCSRIHTCKDTILEFENVTLISSALSNLICNNEQP